MSIPEGLRRDLSGIPILEDQGSLRMKSRDFFWFSPILREKLEDKRAGKLAHWQTQDMQATAEHV